MHDLRHLLQVARVIHTLRLPLGLLSTAAVLVRLPLLWWAYLSDHPILLLLCAGLGQALILLAYRIDLATIHYVSQHKEQRQPPTSSSP